MKRVAELTSRIINVLLGEDTPPAVDFVRRVRNTPFATR